MKTLFALIFVFSVVVLGYVGHVDAQSKKQQELMKIVHDAEHSLQTIRHNPNYIQHTQLTAYQAKD